jgi:hypothetical protein
MKCLSSAFSAQGSRVIIGVVQVAWAVEIYVAANGGAQEKGKRGWKSVYYQYWWKN